MRSTGRRKTDGSSLVRVSWIAMGGRNLVSRRLALDPQDLRERRTRHVELLGRWLARAEDALDLVARQAQQARERAVGVAIRPREHLHGEREAADADDRVRQRAPQARAARGHVAGG